jgi:hypothetical protein
MRSSDFISEMTGGLEAEVDRDDLSHLKDNFLASYSLRAGIHPEKATLGSD